MSQIRPHLTRNPLFARLESRCSAGVALSKRHMLLPTMPSTCCFLRCRAGFVRLRGEGHLSLPMSMCTTPTDRHYFPTYSSDPEEPTTSEKRGLTSTTSGSTSREESYEVGLLLSCGTYIIYICALLSVCVYIYMYTDRHTHILTANIIKNKNNNNINAHDTVSTNNNNNNTMPCRQNWRHD